MKAIILAAGEGKRMYPLTQNCPKALLPINDNETILDTLLNNIYRVKEIDTIFIVVSAKQKKYFKKWKNNKKVLIVTTEISNNVIDCLYYVIKSQMIKDTIFVAAADNILLFDINLFVDYYLNQSTRSTVMYYEENSIEKLKKTGVAMVKDGELREMEEKPKNPRYNFAIPPFYIIPREDIHYLQEFLEENIMVDSLGTFLEWFAKKTKINAFLMPGERINLGDKNAYLKYINKNKGEKR